MFYIQADSKVGETSEQYRARKTAAAKNLKTYSFEDGKYKFVRDTDTGQIIDVLRHDQHWLAGMEYCHQKCIHAMLNRIDVLEAQP